MANFKLEVWDIENGIVITRPVKVGVDGDGEEILKSSAVYREDPFVALKEAQVALDNLKARYTKLVQQKK